MPLRLKRILLNKKLLQQWGPFSMSERVEIIEKVWGYKTNRSFLTRFYKANNVRYLRAKEVYRRSLRQQHQLDPQRQ